MATCLGKRNALTLTLKVKKYKAVDYLPMLLMAFYSLCRFISYCQVINSCKHFIGSYDKQIRPISLSSNTKCHVLLSCSFET